MQKECEKFSESSILEGMTSIRALLKAIKEKNPTNDRRIEKILYNCEKLSEQDPTVRFLMHRSRELGFELVASSAKTIDELTLGASHGGIIAVCSQRSIPSLTAENIKQNGFYCMIQGIEDPYNFGYSIRSLYACGCDGIILPERNWLSAAGVVARSSAGASELFPIYNSDALAAADIFHQKGYTIVCADERTDNVLGECTLEYPLLLIVGGEKRGISKELLNKTDVLVKIDYAREFRASLSAASATTMFAYEIMRQNKG